MLVRTTGRVKRVESRSGTKVDGKTGEVRPWTMTFATLIVAGQGQVEVRVDDDMPRSIEGTWVDWLCNAEAFGPRLSITRDEDWQAEYDAPKGAAAKVA